MEFELNSTFHLAIWFKIFQGNIITHQDYRFYKYVLPPQLNPFICFVSFLQYVEALDNRLILV